MLQVQFGKLAQRSNRLLPRKLLSIDIVKQKGARKDLDATVQAPALECICPPQKRVNGMVLVMLLFWSHIMDVSRTAYTGISVCMASITLSVMSDMVSLASSISHVTIQWPGQSADTIYNFLCAQNMLKFDSNRWIFACFKNTVFILIFVYCQC